MDLLFRDSNLLVLPIWALMILLPRWRWTARIIRSPLVSAAPAILYAALVLPQLGAIWPAVSRPTLPGVEALLGSPAGATIAWAHFLAFDVFVGRLDLSRQPTTSDQFLADGAGTFPDADAGTRRLPVLPRRSLHTSDIADIGP